MTSRICSVCNAEGPDDPFAWHCECGGPFDLPFTPCPALALDGRPFTMWRYQEALPVDESRRVSLDEGFTPLTAARLYDQEVLLKQDHLFPTGSFKDRGASLIVTHAAEMGVASLIEDSSGNAGAAIAAYAARAGIACDIYVPSHASAGKQAQIAAFGAAVHAISGPREAASQAAREAVGQNSGSTFFASHVWNPWFIHGTKTVAYEIWEQLGRKSPDSVVVPTGNGTLLLGLHLGFRELEAGGLTDRVPTLIAVQTAACDVLANMWARGWSSGGSDVLEFPDVQAQPTVAEGIAVAKPARARQILDAVQSTGGRFLTVSEQEIVGAHKLACRNGWYVEPTSAVAIAGIRKLDEVPPQTVIPLTGHGLKYAVE